MSTNITKEQLSALSHQQCQMLLHRLVDESPREVCQMLLRLLLDESPREVSRDFHQIPQEGVHQIKVETLQEGVPELTDMIEIIIDAAPNAHITNTLTKRKELMVPGFDCLGVACMRELERTRDERFKECFTLDEKANKGRKFVKKFLLHLILFVQRLDDSNVTRMLVWFLTKTVLPLKKLVGSYDRLMKKLKEKDLVPDSMLGFIPKYSAGHGRGNPIPKTKEMKAEDDKFNYRSVRLLVGCLTKWFPNGEPAMHAVDRADAIFSEHKKNTTKEKESEPDFVALFLETKAPKQELVKLE